MNSEQDLLSPSLSAQLIDRNPLIRDSELIRHKHQIKHIDNPIPIHIRPQTIHPEPLRYCLNRGFSRIKGFRGLNSTNLRRL